MCIPEHARHADPAAGDADRSRMIDRSSSLRRIQRILAWHTLWSILQELIRDDTVFLDFSGGDRRRFSRLFLLSALVLHRRVARFGCIEPLDQNRIGALWLYSLL
jgi:hypothetical protein